LVEASASHPPCDDVSGDVRNTAGKFTNACLNHFLSHLPVKQSLPMPKKASKSKQVLPTDKVLSVRQPYAQLLVMPSKTYPNIPLKWIENRSWEPPKGIEWILIHASAKPDHFSWYDDYGLRLENCAHGAIIGYAKLIGWKRLNLNTDSDKASKANDIVFKKHCSELRDIVQKHLGIRPTHGMVHVERARNTVHWIFAQPTLLDEPIPCSGKLRLWTLPEN